MPDFLRFYRLGFKSNPFRVLTDEEWAAVSIVPQYVMNIVDHTAHHIQFIGDMGRGKTTLLLGLLSYLQQQEINTTYEYIPEGQHYFKTRQVLDVFMLDEVQRLYWWERRRLYKALENGTRLIFSTHQDIQQTFHQRNLALEVVNVNLLYDRDSLFEMWQRRLDYFRIGESTISIEMDGIDFLIEKFGDDRRSMERFLYEAFQAMESPCPLNREYLVEFRKSTPAERF